MRTGKKYKIAKRLGPSVFDKTQGKKFSLSSEKKGPKKRMSASDFGNKLIQKQRARVTYGVNERQFKNMVERVIAARPANMGEALIAALESRLDNAIYRAGFAPTRRAARQMVAHGHIDVNGRRVTVPSYMVEAGEIITIRERSKKSAMFATFADRVKELRVPAWIALDAEKREAKVTGAPKLAANEVAFDTAEIFQFYTR